MIRDVYLKMCPCRNLLDMVASKWTALIIGALEGEPQRFGELKRRLDGISQKMLTQTLRTLERDGSCNARCTRRCRCASSTS